MADIKLKWEKIAKVNFLDPAFNDWFQINKGYAHFLVSIIFFILLLIKFILIFVKIYIF